MDGAIHGCRVARGAPPVSHLFFADDSLLFFKANIQDAAVIKQCLVRYEKLSGQMVNYNKSNICFSRNTQMAQKQQVAWCLGVELASNFGKYLGLPSFIGRNKRAVFAYIEDKIRQRIGSWNKKLLSQAGKEVLLKSVAQSMPTFSMSVFLLPESVCLSIQRTMNKYWWGTGADRGIHWKAWDKLCIPKKYGGLGFKDLRAFNLAMLGKQAWRFLTEPTTLVAMIYKARYYPTTTFIDATIGNSPSHCWRSIMATHDLVCVGVRRRIGNGRDTLIWGHPWLSDDLSPLVQTHMPEELRQALVSGLVDHDTGTWDPHILNDLFIPEDVSRISRIPISPDYDDTWYWKGDTRGIYTVKNAYRRIMGDYSDDPGMMDSLLEGQVHQAVGILYYLWLARNSALWERALPRPTATVKKAVLTEEAFTRLRRGTTQPNATVRPETEPYGLKCYFDAGYRQHTGEATYGVVLLNHEDVFMAASAGTLHGAFSPIMAEALACKEALSWLKGRDIQRVDLITDCMELHNMITSRSTGTRSTANMHSHTLASLAFDQEHPMYWDRETLEGGKVVAAVVRSSAFADEKLRTPSVEPAKATTGRSFHRHSTLARTQRGRQRRYYHCFFAGALPGLSPPHAWTAGSSNAIASLINPRCYRGRTSERKAEGGDALSDALPTAVG
ncbi:PREDICTED: uncharacterized protein LOC109166487 [Ipomoea nil]|uniref:uncharacterized protein LOC109166487 n=1 Tax=Ipomoea nil TaxID=35883 RepID=UPI000901DC2E|nr:PREDICTED: uncharacterized protein LOC109166487 [Ipomoea nil]